MKLDYQHKHALFDAIAITTLALAPLLERSSRVFLAVSWSAGIALAGVSALTDYPLGAAKVLPPAAHHSMEASLGFGMVFSALLFGAVGMRSAELILAIVGIVLIASGVHALWVERRQIPEPAH